jgi:hypothetical protein
MPPDRPLYRLRSSRCAAQAERARPTERRGFQRHRGRQHARIATGALGEQGRQAQFGQHVHAVVAGRAVGTDAEIGAGRQQLGDWRNPAAELQVDAGQCATVEPRRASSWISSGSGVPHALRSGAR